MNILVAGGGRIAGGAPVLRDGQGLGLVSSGEDPAVLRSVRASAERRRHPHLVDATRNPALDQVRHDHDDRHHDGHNVASRQQYAAQGRRSDAPAGEYARARATVVGVSGQEEEVVGARRHVRGGAEREAAKGGMKSY